MGKEMIKAAVREVIEEKKSEFFIDREAHYEHHQFIAGWMEWSDKIKSTTIKTIVHATVYSILALLVLGFCYKWKG